MFAFTLRYFVLPGQYQRAPTFNLWYHLKLILEIILLYVVTKYLCKHYVHIQTTNLRFCFYYPKETLDSIYAASRFRRDSYPM